ncbi:indolepyruvate oxidoreductase subunit beta family protein [Sulfitobacter sp. D35]|uniref:indolepyruvate oxidoreductase subunit beta family protein n=1 Tax=Sulfitobacter sp. D35 TaxID=3083252 RepID=UPI00296EF1C7|nr:indolepyruvate oxidoreductase subunit beta family protein [Sulfitobacter sp. D35]MDW4500342.1 indolepyruvate oxidoreductase subunit beta family protein [Sulfitobacter sp. D35]
MNDAAPDLAPRAPDTRLDGMIKLAVMAVGGQGGGVLTNWIEDLARAEGYACQATSVAGVAQRTGATIYYVEMVPEADGHAPVFSLAPAAGDVDILIAAEMMEAGRAILRGFVTPDRTTLVASTHRALAVSEKTVPGDGIATAEEVRAAAEVAARRVIFANMERLAVAQGSVISASLFGALAGSGALPFARASFEQAIRRGGRGVEPSLRAFAEGFDAARGRAPEASGGEDAAVDGPPLGPQDLRATWDALERRARALPEPVVPMALAGLRKLVDFQDADYGTEYLVRLDALRQRDRSDKGFEFTREAAKHVANAMAYDDVIRVAGLKTRRDRFARIRDEMGAGETTLMHVTEFMHPRAEEIAGMLPAGLGARVTASRRAMRLLDRLFNRGRRLRTDGLRGFVMLYIVAGLRGWRRRSHRHAQEQAHLSAWLDTALGHLDTDYTLAVEILRCRRLIKGYSDTHARGLSKFDRVLGGAAQVAGRADAAQWVARLREAALADEEGTALDGALRTIDSFTTDTKNREERK